MTESEQQAEALHEQALAASDEGRFDEAIALYYQALALDEARSTTHYNLGLEFKYQGEWQKSLQHNLRAMELAPDDQAAIWNAGIAATALRRWDIARRAWRAYGMPFDEGNAPTDGEFGRSPLRLHPDDDAEVVWGTRICPARIRIDSIPQSEHFHYGDIVLNDGAPMGYRMLGDRKLPVFEALELFEASGFETHVLSIDLASEHELAEVTATLQESGLIFENWTLSIRTLCQQCSEGTPHDHDRHEHDTPQSGQVWPKEFDFAFAVKDEAELDAFIRQWDNND